MSDQNNLSEESYLKERFTKHFNSANGSHITKCAVAVMMTEIEDQLVVNERNSYPEEQRTLFMITYECFVLWAIKVGLESNLDISELEKTIAEVRDHLRSYGWYVPDVFENIWESIQDLMPTMKPGRDTGVVYPLTWLIEAANQAGYKLDQCLNLQFGIHVTVTLGHITKEMKSFIIS